MAQMRFSSGSKAPAASTGKPMRFGGGKQPKPVTDPNAKNSLQQQQAIERQRQVQQQRQQMVKNYDGWGNLKRDLQTMGTAVGDFMRGRPLTNQDVYNRNPYNRNQQPQGSYIPTMQDRHGPFAGANGPGWSQSGASMSPTMAQGIFQNGLTTPAAPRGPLYSGAPNPTGIGPVYGPPAPGRPAAGAGAPWNMAPTMQQNAAQRRATYERNQYNAWRGWQATAARMTGQAADYLSRPTTPPPTVDYGDGGGYGGGWDYGGGGGGGGSYEPVKEFWNAMANWNINRPQGG